MKKKDNFAVVIPARYQSSRFPGKPLINLNGKTMIQHVWERCCEAVDRQLVYIATDSELIGNEAKSFGAQVIMTSESCLTGTDRLAEANLKLGCDFLVNVQGDEPLINPIDIQKVISEYHSNPECVINAMCKISTEDEFYSNTIPKVVATLSGKLLYMSRAGIPTTKNHTFEFAYKQVCIYAFSKQHLNFFLKQRKKAPIEHVEDIEILRFVENDIPIKMVEVSSSSIAIDVPSDVEKVLNELQNI